MRHCHHKRSNQWLARQAERRARREAEAREWKEAWYLLDHPEEMERRARALYDDFDRLLLGFPSAFNELYMKPLKAAIDSLARIIYEPKPSPV